VATSRWLHHIELWVPDLDRARRAWEWLLTALGAHPFQSWEHGRSWRWDDGGYLVLEQSPALSAERHDRCAPGLNHLAFVFDGDLDALVAEAPGHGWTLLFGERHPHAGGPSHRAAYLENADGFEVEVVASAER
jgi:catechol 2,3-dioxygenase-like lactoylglutathione lyase family enzyme